MGQDLSYRAGNDCYECRLSQADFKLIESIREHLPKEADILFTVANLGEKIVLNTQALREAAETVETFFASQSDVLPYSYQFMVERLPNIPETFPYVPRFSAGAMSGLRLPGDSEHYYCIHAGLNECYLVKSALGPDGKGHDVERRDLRGETKLQTENVGAISIRRSRAKTELRKSLREIRSFLARASSESVTKVIE